MDKEKKSDGGSSFFKRMISEVVDFSAGGAEAPKADKPKSPAPTSPIPRRAAAKKDERRREKKTAAARQTRMEDSRETASSYKEQPAGVREADFGGDVPDNLAEKASLGVIRPPAATTGDKTKGDRTAPPAENKPTEPPAKPVGQPPAKKAPRPAAPPPLPVSAPPVFGEAKKAADAEPSRAKRKKKRGSTILPALTAKTSQINGITGVIGDKMRFFLRLLWRAKIALAIGAVFLAVALPFFFRDEPNEVPVDMTPVYVRINPGSAAVNIAKNLEDRGIISSQKAFLRKLRRGGDDSRIQSGSYKFHRGMPYAEIIDIIVNGKTSVIRFTIPEGYRLTEIAARLEKDGVGKAADFLAAAKNFAPYPYIGDDPNIPYRIEGYLFPDTYDVQPEATPKDVLALLARTFDERLTPAMRERAKKMNLSLHEYVTLASLIEKEAMYAEDRPIIAQVFIKRLKIGMPLQSDAPIQYLRGIPKEDLTYADLQVDSPYNTYLRYGLPPGPIASPGRASLESLLQPADTDYLYFVADRQGHNHYSRTYNEHLALVEKYR